MRWPLDEMLPPAAARHLQALGHDAKSVVDVGLAGTDDERIYAHAVVEDRILVTETRLR